MNSNKKTARWVGIFYILATAAYSLAMILLDPIINSPDFLTQASLNANQVLMGAFLVLIDAIAVASIGICMYKILKKCHRTLALGFLSARVVEGTIFIMTIVPTLTLLTLSHELVKTGAQDASYYQALGQALLSAGDWIFLIGYGLVFAISALILNFVLYKSKLVPQWLSGWGFVSAVFVLANFLLQYSGINPVGILDFSIAVQEMVFALWLIVKGFNPSAIASASIRTN
ncbi:DUF4386 domain-containing protein [Patescibacteria group bacterium]|nr:DUF4386 domain-containing protein [Patescibacteria group bacterium]